MVDFADGKRYNSFVGYYKRKYGERLQKLVLDAGFTCPNRDGKVGIGGCTFCDNAAFHPGYSIPEKDIFTQLDLGIEFNKVRYPRAKYYLAYFQSFSNTYGTLDRLRGLYEEALRHPQVVGIVIGTRPDCVDDEKLDYLADLKDGKVLKGWKREICEHPIVTVEYGIESCYDVTLKRVNRGHNFECARKAVEKTAERGIDVGGHFILGLPGESKQMLLDQCNIINGLPLSSVKFHQLQLVRGTVMEREFERCPDDFVSMGLEEYIDFIVDILMRLRPDLYIERIAGEVPPRFVKVSRWGLIRNFELLKMLDVRLEERGVMQGDLYRDIL
ncbi:MAG: TIGR01212 family radical SAM protein [Candidatus Cryptobacteroides sp.]